MPKYFYTAKCGRLDFAKFHLMPICYKGFFNDQCRLWNVWFRPLILIAFFALRRIDFVACLWNYIFIFASDWMFSCELCCNYYWVNNLIKFRKKITVNYIIGNVIDICVHSHFQKNIFAQWMVLETVHTPSLFHNDRLFFSAKTNTSQILFNSNIYICFFVCLQNLRAIFIQ